MEEKTSQKIDSGKTIQAAVKRFHDCLLQTHAKVQKVLAEKKHLQVREGFLKVDMLIRGGNPDSMRYGNTLSDGELKPVESSEVIAKRIEQYKRNLMAQLHKLFGASL